MYYVEIVEFETEKVVKRMGGYTSERRADILDKGVNINLNHDKFFTRIVNE